MWRPLLDRQSMVWKNCATKKVFCDFGSFGFSFFDKSRLFLIGRLLYHGTNAKIFAVSCLTLRTTWPIGYWCFVRVIKETVVKDTRTICRLIMTQGVRSLQFNSSNQPPRPCPSQGATSPCKAMYVLCSRVVINKHACCRLPLVVITVWFFLYIDVWFSFLVLVPAMFDARVHADLMVTVAPHDCLSSHSIKAYCTMDRAICTVET